MQVRHILRIAIFFGAIGVLGGQGVQAQSPNSLRFVRMLLLRESRQIFVDQTAIARQNHGIRLLNLLGTFTPATARQARQLNQNAIAIERNVVLLQRRIDRTTQLLLSLSDQLSSTLLGLGNPAPFAAQAAQNAAKIDALASRGPFGVPAATIAQ